MIGTRVWGPMVWKILHMGAALKYPPRFYKLVTTLIPCPVCVSHYNRNMKLPDATKLINFHSMVNAYHVKPRRTQVRPPEGGWIEHYKKFTRADIIIELDSLQRKLPNLRQQIDAVKREIKSYV
jgi:hypothetical protein